MVKEKKGWADEVKKDIEKTEKTLKRRENTIKKLRAEIIKIRKEGGECRMKKNEWRDKAKISLKELKKLQSERIDIILNLFLFKILFILSTSINLYLLWLFVI